MTDEHKKAITEGRKKYFEAKRKAKQEETICDKCTMIEWYEKQMNITVDRNHCPIKCRYNKEVIDNGNNE